MIENNLKDAPTNLDPTIKIKKIFTKTVLYEFLRYVFVGGCSFLVDLAVLMLCKEKLFIQLPTNIITSASVAAGFCVGLCTNYLLSQWLVFRNKSQRALGWTKSAFFLYSIIGLIGLLGTELGMHLGLWLVGDKGFRYVIVKFIVAGIILIWNYLGRKIWIYQGT